MFHGTDPRHLSLHAARASAPLEGGRPVTTQHALVRDLSRRQLGKLTAAVGLSLFASAALRARAEECPLPARNPIEGPYFLGDPEQRSETGRGLRITGTVRDAATCQPISGAHIVRWHANQYGLYEEYYRALMITGSDGKFALSSIPPGQYANLDPHVHWYVTAPGYQAVIAQIQWAKQAPIPASATFDFSLIRA